MKIPIEIRKFPSQYFYEDKLIDGENVKSVNWDLFNNKNTIDYRIKPYLFYNVFGKESRSGSSFVNPTGKFFFRFFSPFPR